MRLRAANAMFHGIRHPPPSIVIPAIADTRDHDRRRACCCTSAHVARYDCLTWLTAAVCAILVPPRCVVDGPTRSDREGAGVRRSGHAVGTGPREYAGHPLEIAYSFGGHRDLRWRSRWLVPGSSKAACLPRSTRTEIAKHRPGELGLC